MKLLPEYLEGYVDETNALRSVDALPTLERQGIYDPWRVTIVRRNMELRGFGHITRI